MSLLDAPDRQSQFIRLILVILGMCLAVVGWLRWIRGFLLLPVLFATPMAASIQPPAADADVATPAPAFAVAVVTAHKSDGTSRQGTQLEPGGRFKATSVTLKDLIQSAYRRHAFDRRDIAGGPAWIDTDRFDIVATAPGEHSLRRDGFPAQTWLMLRSLLADRFRLKMRTERRDVPIYALVLAAPAKKPGPRLVRSDVDCGAVLARMLKGERMAPTCASASYPGRIVGNALTMTSLASLLSDVVDRVVVDQTGLDGPFDVELEAVEIRPPGPFGPSYRPSDTTQPVAAALPEQLGLILEPATGAIETLVVEHAERPTED